jgi:hypothetical protein
MTRLDKQFIIFILVAVMFGINTIKAQQYMRLHLTDGTVVAVAVDDIRKLTFDVITFMEQKPELVQQLIKLKAFPNPAKEQLTLYYSLNESGIVKVEMLNQNGIGVESDIIGFQQPGKYYHQIKTEGLKTGLYLCRIRQNNQVVTEKIVIKN